jgi:hypothetical protein
VLPGRGGRAAVVFAALVAATSAIALPVSAASSLRAGGASTGEATHVTVSPSKNLDSGELVSVSVSGEPAGATLLAVECSPVAVTIGEDGCENRSNAVSFAGPGGASVNLRVFASINTAVGVLTCGSTCLVAAVRLSAGNAVSIVGAVGISFEQGGPSTSGQGPPAPPAWQSPPGVPTGKVLLAGQSAGLTLQAGVAGDLASPAAVTGAGVTLPADRVPPQPVTGVALLQLVLAAPATSWASATDTAAVVDVKVRNGPVQQIVLFAGSRPFTYAAQFGDLSTGSQQVSVTVDGTLSNSRAPLEVRLIASRLSIVAPSNPAYLAMQYAPIVYGRPDSAASDTPLLSFVQESAAAGAAAGTERLVYTTIWSKEDAGTSFVPWLELGEWGRMTDITETVALEVTPAGAIVDPTYDSCGCSATYPVNRTSPKEEEVPFHGQRYGTHLIVRNASGNDYQDDTGSSTFRMEQPPVPGPVTGAVRETVMDAHPWTYRVAAEELSRWYADGSTSPTSPEIGDSRQYAIVDLSVVTRQTDAVGVAIELKGSTTWYSNDFSSGYSLYDGGHGRTVVKLPLGWESSGIAAVRLVEYPSSAGASIKDVHLDVLALTEYFGLAFVPSPAPVVLRARDVARPASDRL